MPPQLSTSGVTTLGQSYDNPAGAATLTKTLPLLQTALRGPVLVVLAQKVATDAAGSNGVDAVNTVGTSSVAAGIVSFMASPLLPTSAVTPLRVQFSKLKASANYGQVLPGAARRSGSTSFGQVTLSGALVGPKPITFNGDIQPNTVVVNTPTVKITLNAQAIPQQPVCEPGQICPLYRVLETVETQAVHIELTKALVQGHRVSGDIVIGDAEAGQ